VRASELVTASGDERPAMENKSSKVEANVNGDTEIVTISDVIGEGSEAHRIVRVENCVFRTTPESTTGELRMRDVDFATKLGHGRARLG
jgi:hypothetical protein